MRKRQIAKADRLFQLSMVAQMDESGCETDEDFAVVEWAIADAKQRLERMGHGPMGYATLTKCIESAKEPS